MPTDGSDRVARFEQLLTGPVGDRLCRMYARYWQPDDLAHYLEEAALYSKDHKSTLSITDSVSIKTCAVCVYYIVYQLYPNRKWHTAYCTIMTTTYIYTGNLYINYFY